MESGMPDIMFALIRAAIGNADKNGVLRGFFVIKGVFNA